MTGKMKNYRAFAIDETVFVVKFTFDLFGNDGGYRVVEEPVREIKITHAGIKYNGYSKVYSTKAEAEAERKKLVK
jgi:hypothetical protein